MAVMHLLTVAVGGTGSGTVTNMAAGILCPGMCSALINEGAMVTLQATAAMGSTFTGWSGGGCSGTGTCTVTVNASTMVTATFTRDPVLVQVALAGSGVGRVTSAPAGIDCGMDCSELVAFGSTLTLTAAPSVGSTFAGWSGGGCTGTGPCVVTATAAASVTATFTLDSYTLSVSRTGTGTGTVTSSPAGISCGVDCSEPYPFGTLVTLTAAPAMGSTFTGWGGACTGTAPCSVTIAAATTVTANFALDTYVLTVARAGTGTGTVTSVPGGINCGADCTEPYGFGSMVALTAAPAVGSSFAGWSGGGCSGTGVCTVPINAVTTVTATFTVITHTLNVGLFGTGTGTVTSTPAGINCGADCSEPCVYGTMVTLTATPAPGTDFGGWSGSCTGTGPCTVSMTGPVNVQAVFNPSTYVIGVVKTGTGTGTVSSAPAGISCGADCSESWPYNQPVILTATADPGSSFVGWSGGGCTGTGACILTVTQSLNVTASFQASSHLLTVQPAGTGSGLVTSLPDGIACGIDCTEPYLYGTMVTLTAAPSVGSTFAGWSGGGCTGTGTCVVTITAATTVTATFTPNTFVLDIAKSGSGTGTVTSAPAGINCGADCSEPYVVGSMVTLTAAASPSSTFLGWLGGGCTGTAPCTVTVTAATTVSAFFTLNQYVVTAVVAGTGTGTIVSSPAGIACPGDCTEPWNAGTIVQLTAAAGPSSTFAGWSGGGCSGTGTCTVTVNSAMTVTATFNTTTYVLSVATAGTGAGVVTSAPAGINCGATCNASFNTGTMVTLSAAPSGSNVFAGWSGACSGRGSCVVTMSAATSVTATFSLPPNVMFITSTTHTGALGGLAGADAICTARASAAGLTGTYVAWLSTSTVNAINRLGTASGWVRRDGLAVFNTTADIVAGNVLYLPNVNESGVSVGAQYFHTATSGTGVASGGTCTDWTVSSTAAVGAGRTSWASRQWTSANTLNCQTTVPIMCFGIDRAGFAAPPLTTNRRAFLSSANFTPNTGLAAADTICATEATAAGLPGTFRALLATTGASPASRFSTAGTPWTRVDDVVLSSSAATFFSATQWNSAISKRANGSIAISNTAVWAGSTSLNTVGTAVQTCNDWSGTTGNGAAGIADDSLVATGFGGGFSACATARPIYCLQQ